MKLRGRGGNTCSLLEQKVFTFFTSSNVFVDNLAQNNLTTISSTHSARIGVGHISTNRKIFFCPHVSDIASTDSRSLTFKAIVTKYACHIRISSSACNSELTIRLQNNKQTISFSKSVTSSPISSTVVIIGINIKH